MHDSLTQIWETQIYPNLLLYLDNLNWLFIITFIIVLYGIKHTEHYTWFNDYANLNKHVKKFKSWIVGITIGLTFFLFRILGPDEFHSEYIAQYLRSLIVSITFSGLLIDWPIKLIEGNRFNKDSKK